MKLLHIDSSALGQNSVTRELGAAIVAHWSARADRPQVQYRDLDLEPLPHLSGRSLAKADPAEAAQAEQVLEQFLAADVLVIGAPMYNFGIPSTLRPGSTASRWPGAASATPKTAPRAWPAARR